MTFALGNVAHVKGMLKIPARFIRQGQVAAQRRLAADLKHWTPDRCERRAFHAWRLVPGEPTLCASCKREAGQIAAMRREAKRTR